MECRECQKISQIECHKHNYILFGSGTAQWDLELAVRCPPGAHGMPWEKHKTRSHVTMKSNNPYQARNNTNQTPNLQRDQAAKPTNGYPLPLWITSWLCKAEARCMMQRMTRSLGYLRGSRMGFHGCSNAEGGWLRELSFLKLQRICPHTAGYSFIITDHNWSYIERFIFCLIY